MNQEYLKDNIDDLQLILDLSYDLITIADHEAKIIAVSKSTERIFGVLEKNLIGMRPKDLEHYGILDKSITEKVLRTKEKITMIQKTARGKTLFVSAHPILKDNEIHKIIIFSKDISEKENLLDRLNSLADESEWYKSEYNKRLALVTSDAITTSDPMQGVMDMVHHISNLDVTVLLLGKTGVGKGYIASLIHGISDRKAYPFITVNCGAIPANLLESELFGYTEGAFTGAKKGGKKGLFEVAGEGTIFLDEIGDMPLDLQVKILHVLDNNKVIPVGGEFPVEIKSRIIAATNKDLRQEVEDGKFREDLYYRLNIMPITIPPLSQRREDIPLLIDKFTDKFNNKYKTQKTINSEAYLALINKSYPGNVRELEHTIERLIVMSTSDMIDEEVVNLLNTKKLNKPNEFDLSNGQTLKEAMDEYEKEIFKKALAKHKTTRKIGAALGIDQSTVVRKIKKMGL